MTVPSGRSRNSISASTPIAQESAAPNPRVISDQGSQFKSRDFHRFLGLIQASHVLTSPHYPQSNGKLERFHRTLKEQAIAPKSPLCAEDLRRQVSQFIDYYNTERLHSALAFIAPFDRLADRHRQIHAERDKKLEAAREKRRLLRQHLRAPSSFKNQPASPAALSYSSRAIRSFRLTLNTR